MQSIHTDSAEHSKQSSPSVLLHQSPRLAQPYLYCIELLFRFWIYEGMTTGSNIQVPESRICLIVFERQILEVLEGRRER